MHLIDVNRREGRGFYVNELWRVLQLRRIRNERRTKIGRQHTGHMGRYVVLQTY